MVNACADPDFLSEGEGREVQAQRRENSFDFLCFSPKFSGDAGGPTIYVGGGGGGGPNANFYRI